MLETLGIRLDPVEIPPNTVWWTIKDSNLHLGGWTADYPDPDNLLRQSHYYLIPSNRGWRHPRLDELLEQAARTVDRVRRLAMYREADRILVNDEVVAVPLFYRRRGGFELLKPWMKRVRHDTTGFFDLRDVIVEPH